MEFFLKTADDVIRHVVLQTICGGLSVVILIVIVGVHWAKKQKWEEFLAALFVVLLFLSFK